MIFIYILNEKDLLLELMNYKILNKLEIIKKYNVKNLEKIIEKLNFKLIKKNRNLIKLTKDYILYLDENNEKFLSEIKMNYKIRRKIITKILCCCEEKMTAYRINKKIGGIEGEEKKIKNDINEIIKTYNYRYDDYINNFNSVKRKLTANKTKEKIFINIIEKYFFKIYLKRGFFEEEKLLKLLFENLELENIYLIYDVIQETLSKEKYCDINLIQKIFSYILLYINDEKINKIQKSRQIIKYKLEYETIKKIMEKISKIEKKEILNGLIYSILDRYIYLRNKNKKITKISTIKKEYKIMENIITYNKVEYFDRKIVELNKVEIENEKIRTKLLLEIPKGNEKYIIQNYEYLLQKLDIVEIEKLNLKKVEEKNSNYDQILIISNADIKLNIKNISGNPMFFIKNENIKGVKQNRAMIIKNTIKIYEQMKYYRNYCLEKKGVNKNGKSLL